MNSSTRRSSSSSSDSISSSSESDSDEYSYCGSVDTVYSFQLQEPFVQVGSPDFVSIAIKPNSKRTSESIRTRNVHEDSLTEMTPDNVVVNVKHSQSHTREEEDDNHDDSDDEDGTIYIYRGYRPYEARVDPNVVTKVKVHRSVGGEIPDRAFRNCSVLCQVQLPLGLVKIGMGAFEGCVDLRHIQIPSTVVEIQRNAFWSCKSLRHLILPEGFRIVGIGAFAFCTSLATVVYPSTLKEIRDGAFHWDCELTTVYLKEGLRRIGKDAFSHCESLVNVNIPRTVKHIATGCFDGCKQLFSVEMSSSSLQNIGTYAFHMCQSLRLIYHESHVQVENGAFFACQDLQVGCDKDEAELQNWIGTMVAHRLEDLPLHRLCYRQACESAQNQVTHDERIAQVLQHATTLLVDGYGMTAMHILALSVRPNVTLFEKIQDVYPKVALMAQDKWKTTPLEYLCNNRAPGSMDLLQSMMEWGFRSRIQHLGLVSWKQDVHFEMYGFVSDFDNNILLERRKQLDQFIRKLLQCERLEVLSLLECALWKSKLLQFGNAPKDRSLCRFRCGADVVIVNVLLFLGPVMLPAVTSESLLQRG